MPIGPDVYNTGNKMEGILGPERALELKNYLLAGKTARDLVPVLQEQMQLFTDVKPSTLLTMIYRFNREVVRREAVQRVMATVANTGHIKVSSLEDLADLCRKQKKRLEVALSLESKTKFLTQQASNEMRLLADMLKNLALLQLETGLLPRAPKTVTGTVVDESGHRTYFGWTEQDATLLDKLTLEHTPNERDADPTAEPRDEPEDGVDL